MAADTLTVAELSGLIEDRLRDGFPNEVWVRGAIADLSRARTGHVYFTLVDDDHEARVSVMLHARTKDRVNRLLMRAGGGVRMQDGTAVRIRGRVAWYGPRGRLQLQMASIDPEFTLGRLAADRAALVAALRADGSYDRNAGIPLPPMPLRVAVVTSDGSAAHADVLHTLTGSGFRFEVHVADVWVQGPEAATSIAAGIARSGRRPVDVVLVVRGGGGASDLAAFDQEVVARSIADCPVPVVTGVGHEIDRTVAEEVAHHGAKTPTAAAAFVVQRVADSLALAEDRYWRIMDRASTVVTTRLDDLEARSARAARAAGGVAHRELSRLDGRAERVGRGARRILDDHQAQLTRHGARLRTRAEHVLELAEHRLDVVHARIGALDPAAALARGWALVHTADGALVRSADDLAEGDAVVATLGSGRIRATVDARLPE